MIFIKYKEIIKESYRGSCQNENQIAKLKKGDLILVSQYFLFSSNILKIRKWKKIRKKQMTPKLTVDS